ncbi:MAG: hypothetical protein ABFS39_19395, partial [Pseudomonadota bacterium]
MTRQRDILKFLRILAQAAVLFAMFTPMVASAMTNRFVIVDSDGNRTRGPLSDFRVDMIGPDPQAALLLPAVQAAREAAR